MCKLTFDGNHFESLRIKAAEKNLGKDVWCLWLSPALIPNCSFQTTSKIILVCGQTARGITGMFEKLMWLSDKTE